MIESKPSKLTVGRRPPGMFTRRNEREQDVLITCPRGRCGGSARATVVQYDDRLPKLVGGNRRKCDRCGRWFKVVAHVHLTGVMDPDDDGVDLSLGST